MTLDVGDSDTDDPNYSKVEITRNGTSIGFSTSQRQFRVEEEQATKVLATIVIGTLQQTKQQQYLKGVTLLILEQ